MYYTYIRAYGVTRMKCTRCKQEHTESSKLCNRCKQYMREATAKSRAKARKKDNGIQSIQSKHVNNKSENSERMKFKSWTNLEFNRAYRKLIRMKMYTIADYLLDNKDKLIN